MIRQGASGGFRAALVFYPGCGREALLENDGATTAPLSMFLGSRRRGGLAGDLPARRRALARAPARSIAVTLYPGATHDFDDPGERRQAVPGNQAAKADAMARAAAVIDATGKP